MPSHDSDARHQPPLRAPREEGEFGRTADLSDFSELFDAHFEELTRYAYRYVQSTDEAKDVVHDAFLRLWQQREEIDFRTSVRAYLFTTVRNLAVDRIRRHRVQERWRIRVSQQASTGPLVAPDDPDRDLANRDLAALVADAVAALPPRQREVLLLRWHRQASYNEIARMLDISPKTVGIHVTRALATLRHTLRHPLGNTAIAKPRSSDK